MDAMGKSQENNNNITDLGIHQTLTPSETKHPHESQHMFSCKKQQKRPTDRVEFGLFANSIHIPLSLKQNDSIFV